MRSSDRTVDIRHALAAEGTGQRQLAQWSETRRSLAPGQSRLVRTKAAATESTGKDDEIMTTKP